jgi:hypothetical protein
MALANAQKGNSTIAEYSLRPGLILKDRYIDYPERVEEPHPIALIGVARTRV